MQQEINNILSKFKSISDSPSKPGAGGKEILSNDFHNGKIVETDKLTPAEIKNNQSTPQTKTLVSVNIEKMPLYFLGSSKECQRLHKSIIESGKPLILYDTIQNGKGYKLSISPSAVYGLLTGFDQDVFAVIQCKLYEATKKGGTCPDELTLWLSEFPKIMKIQKTGKLYEHIRESVRRLSETTIYHENFVKARTERQEDLAFFQDTALKLIHYKMMRHETVMKENSPLVQRQYIAIGIPKWLQNDINSNYITAFDPDLYFTISGDRPRRLYRFLELIRYEKVRKVPYRKILTELTMTNIATNINRNIKRIIDPLVDIGYLESYQINDDHINFFFKDVKSSFVSFQNSKQEPLNFQQQEIVETILGLLKDDKSRDWYNHIARTIPEEVIHLCLSLTKETEQIDGIKTSKGAVFTDHIKRECARREISLN
jgi:hypothetical protein